MSTVVAVIKNGQGCMAADSLTSFGDSKQSHQYVADSEKVIEWQGNLIGLVGSAAHHLVMQSVLERHAKQFDPLTRSSLFESLRKLHPILKDEYYLNPKDEDDDAYESSQMDFLLLNSTGLYGVYSLREVDQYTKFWAIGSGAEYALGAMFAHYDSEMTAEAIAAIGVKAGAEFDASSALPLSSHCVDIY